MQMTCRASLQETVVDTETVATVIYSSQSKGKGKRDQNVVHSLREIISKISLNGKLTRPYEVRELLSNRIMKLRLTWRSNIGKREIRMWLFMSLIRSLNLNDFSYNRRIRLKDKISLYGELELRIRLFQENHARDCQEIKELRRICCEETDQARRATNEELSMQQHRFDDESDDGPNSGFTEQS